MSDIPESSVWRCGMKGFEFLEKSCPLKWQSLRATDDVAVRHCDLCDQRVYAVSSPEEFVERSKRRECVALEIELTKNRNFFGLGMPMPWSWETDSEVRQWWAQVRDASDDAANAVIRKDLKRHARGAEARRRQAMPADDH